MRGFVRYCYFRTAWCLGDILDPLRFENTASQNTCSLFMLQTNKGSSAARQALREAVRLARRCRRIREILATAFNRRKKNMLKIGEPLRDT